MANCTGGLLDLELLDSIDAKKEGLEEGGLEQCLEKSFHNMRMLTAEQASLFDEDNRQGGPEVVERYKQAMVRAKELYDGNSSNLYLLLGEIGAILEPAQGGREGFAPLREGMTAIPGINYVPPSDKMRIQKELERVIDYVEHTLLHPVEEATFLYFHVARIQPLEHANKRSAAVIMNTVLQYHGYPAISLTPRDRVAFASLFRSAIDSYRTDMAEGAERICNKVIGPGQRGLMAFFAGKVDHALDTIDLGLQALDKYRVQLKAKDPGVKFRAKRIVASYLHQTSGETPYQVRLRRQDHELEVVGDITKQQLDDVLQTILCLKFKVYDRRDM